MSPSIIIQLGTTFEFKPEARANDGNNVVLNPKSARDAFSFCKLKKNPQGENVIWPVPGTEFHNNIGRITGQLSVEEVEAAMRRGERESGWPFNKEMIESAQAGGSKEIF